MLFDSDTIIFIFFFLVDLHGKSHGHRPSHDYPPPCPPRCVPSPSAPRPPGCGAVKDWGFDKHLKRQTRWIHVGR